jgi:hypothetical protein
MKKWSLIIWLPLLFLTFSFSKAAGEFDCGNTAGEEAATCVTGTSCGAGKTSLDRACATGKVCCISTQTLNSGVAGESGCGNVAGEEAATCITGTGTNCGAGKKSLDRACGAGKICCITDQALAANSCVLAGNTCAGSCNSATETQVAGSCPTANQKCCAPKGGAGTGSGTGTGGAATGSTGSTAAVNIQLANPLKFSTVEGVLTSVMGGLKGIVVTLAILMIVIGAIMYILSFGNPDNIKRAKNIIFAALIGLAIVIAAPAFLREISVLLGWQGAPDVPGGGTQLTLTQIATNILKFLLSLVGVLALIVMIIAAIMLFVSFGNPDKRKAALEVLKAAIIGVVVAMGSMILVTAVARFFQP